MRQGCGVHHEINEYSSFSDGIYLDEQNIIDKIMHDYRIDVRPQVKPHSPVKIKFDVRMKGLNNLVRNV